MGSTNSYLNLDDSAWYERRRSSVPEPRAALGWKYVTLISSLSPETTFFVCSERLNRFYLLRSQLLS
jgi:hypothetical protein